MGCFMLNIDILRGKLRTLFPNKRILGEVETKFNKRSGHGLIPFMDTPINGNLGDQALALAGLVALSQQRPKEIVLEIQNYQVRSALRYLNNNLEANTPVFWNGGGNIGSLYPYEEHNRWESFKILKRHPIIMFPQSVYFSNDSSGSRMLKDSIRHYSSKQSLTVFLREKKSFDFFQANYPDVESYLTPDTVLLLDKYVSTSILTTRRNGILFLIRNDIERNPHFNSGRIEAAVSEAGFEIDKGDTYLGGVVVGPENRKDLLWRMWNRIGSKQVVITDRLHGMIFAYLTRTPAVVLANNNWKIESTYQTWLKDCNFIHFLSDYDEKTIINSVRKLVNVNPESLELQTKFSKFFEKVKNV